MKKIFYIILLIILIIVVIYFFKFLNNNNKDVSNGVEIGSNKDQNVTNETKKEKTIIKTLKDGTLYSFTDEEIKSDIVIGDNYYDTQITDMYNNFSSYEGKVIEIEGMYLESEPYTFVGRYSTSNLCQFCPQGISYIEYIWEGDKLNLTDGKEWLKVKGTLCKGNDETSYYQDFYYLKVLSIEIMNERGIDTVNN